MLLQSSRAFTDEHFVHPETKALAAIWGMHLDYGPDISGGALFSFLESIGGQEFGMVLGKGGADNLIKSGKFKDYASVFNSPGFRKKYEPNKFTKFDIVVGVVPIPPKKEDKKPEPSTEKTEKNFKFLFFYEDTDWNFDFDLPNFNWKYTSSGKAPGFWKISENVCEQKWWQRIFKKYISFFI